MIRVLLLAAIVGAAAYHFGVEAGKKEARAEWSVSAAQPHHHKGRRSTPALAPQGDAEGDLPRRPGQGMDRAVEDEAHLLEHKATDAVASTLKAQATSTLHDAVAYIGKKLTGDHQEPDWAPAERTSDR